MKFIIPSLLISIVLIFHIDKSSACQRCRSLEECKAPPPTFCPYGEYENICGRRTCLKGPGEKCGGPPLNSFGECVTGTFCHKEGRCYGCFLATLECFPK